MPDNEATWATRESPVIDEEPTDLVQIIRYLNCELKFAGTAEDIASEMDAVVNILYFSDSTVASRTVITFLEVRSVACSACLEENRPTIHCTNTGKVQLNSVYPAARQSFTSIDVERL